MKRSIAMVVLAAALTGLAAHPATNGWEQMGLRSRVKELSVTTGVDEYLYTETTSFDEEGNFLHLKIMDMDYLFADGDIIYEYDDAGRVISITSPTNEDNRTETFLYSEDGFLFLTTATSEGAGIAFTERTYWDRQGRKALTTEHEWNDLVWVESYAYNDLGELVQSIRPASPNGRLGYSTYTYDERGNPLLVNEWDLGNWIRIQTRYEYEYDAQGNILLSNKYLDYFDGLGEVLEEITRCEYVYYEEGLKEE